MRRRARILGHTGYSAPGTRVDDNDGFLNKKYTFRGFLGIIRGRQKKKGKTNYQWSRQKNENYPFTRETLF